MQTKAEILAANPSLSSYQVMLHERAGNQDEQKNNTGNDIHDDDPIAFDCYAEDDEHAVEQAKNAYPEGNILLVTAHAGNSLNSNQNASNLGDQIRLYVNNKAAILGVLEKLKVESVTMCYSGRDNTKEDLYIINGHISNMSVDFSDDVRATYQTADGASESSFNSLLEIFTEATLSNLGRDDYEVDAGGGGELKITLDGGLVEIDHYENDETQNIKESSFTDASTCSAIFDYNKNTALAALKSAGISAVTATYIGGGDSGEVSTIECSNAAGQVDLNVLDSVAVNYQTSEQMFDSKSASWSVVIKEVSGNLKDLIYQLTDGVVDEIDRSGYQNNEGGGGTLTFNVNDGCVDVLHYDNEVEVTRFQYVLSNEGLVSLEPQDEIFESHAPSN